MKSKVKKVLFKFKRILLKTKMNVEKKVTVPKEYEITNIKPKAKDHINICFCGNLNLDYEIINNIYDYSEVKEKISEYDLTLFYSNKINNIFNENTYNVKDKNQIFNFNGYLISVLNLDIKKIQKARREVIKASKQSNYVIVYTKTRYIGNSINKKDLRKMKILNNYGADYVVGLNNKTKKYKFQTRLNIFDKKSNIAYSIPNLFKRNSFVVGLELSKSGYENKNYYIPIYQNRFDENIKLEILDMRYRDISDMDRRAYLSRLENSTSNITPINKMLTIGEMCSVIGVKLPRKYAYLERVQTGKICSRSFENEVGSTFFFREPYHDKNDKEIEPLEKRMRLLNKALKKGAKFVVSYVKLPKEIPHIYVPNTIMAHVLVCSHISNFYNIKTIGITGSIGKTSTKDMLYCVLRQQYKTEISVKNSNVQVNIGLKVQQLKADTEIYIQEIGGGRVGGAYRHSKMINPDATLITNIGDAHIGNFGSRELIMENKLQIAKGMNEGGILYLNGDDKLLWKARKGKRVITYAVDNKKATYHAENIKSVGFSTTFDIVSDEGTYNAQINVLGKYNVLNAVACFAIGRQFGIEPEVILDGLLTFKTSGIRQNLIYVCGKKLILDCFNASPSSVKSSLEYLCNVPLIDNGKRIAVIGDITGMGELNEQIHLEVADIIKDYPIDTLICYGDSTKIIYDKLNKTFETVLYLDNHKKLQEFLESNVKDSDIVVFKGSSKMKLECVVDATYGTNLTDDIILSEMKFKTITDNKITYKVFEDYAILYKYNGKKKEIHVGLNIEQKPIFNIFDKAFIRNRTLKKISFSSKMRHIGYRAFYRCQNLEKVKFVNGLKFIADEAFANCSALVDINLPNTLLHIGNKAFYNTNSLKQITIPSSVCQIGEDAFNQDTIIRCFKDSYAYNYAKDHNLQYEIINKKSANSLNYDK